MKRIDLRSDTVTQPTPGMREAMASAIVGDDVWGEDPTVRDLEERVAALLGMEMGLFVPSGTMANQIALKVHTQHGDEVLAGAGSHCILYEAGASAAISGVQFRTLGGDQGLFSEDDVLLALHDQNIHLPPTTLIWIENTHNRGGGRIFPLESIRAITEMGHTYHLAVHMDGARLLNAAMAQRLPPHVLVANVDSASICLSKGLGAPVGSVLVGSKSFIFKARRFRKMFGGGMRQAGILAAAGLYALDHHVERLREDHANAKWLAEGFARMRRLRVDVHNVETNIVLVDIIEPALDAAIFIERCANYGLFFSQFGPKRLRAVTHLDITRDDCEQAITILEEVIHTAS